VTERMESGRSVRKSSRLYGWMMAPGGRLRVVTASAVLILCSAIVGYLIGHDLAFRPLVDATQLIEQLQPENQKLKKETLDQNSRLIALQAKLTSVQSALDAILPTKNTYNISPNQSMIVANGHLTIGLIGSPTNESITININGKQQLAVTGDVFKIAPDPLTACQVGVQSFNMFKAVLTASCAAVKPR
jgi:hypothetical protein